MYEIQIVEEGNGGKLKIYSKEENYLKEIGWVKYEDENGKKLLIGIFKE